MTTALIDGDVIVYECGFASDRRAKDDELEYEDLSHCLHGVKLKIQDIMETTGCDERRIFLTGENNFRLEIAPDYKANRDPTHKPHWYNEIKEYLINYQDAEVVDGIEADDAMGWNQTDDTIICTKDKDLDMVPGKHYNWSPKRRDDGVYNVSEVEGLRFFYTQILTGDSTDNIPGLYKITGQKATAKIKAPLQELTDECVMWTYVLTIYLEANLGSNSPLPLEELKEAVCNTARCLFISHGEREIWKNPLET